MFKDFTLQIAVEDPRQRSALQKNLMQSLKHISIEENDNNLLINGDSNDFSTKTIELLLNNTLLQESHFLENSFLKFKKNSEKIFTLYQNGKPMFSISVIEENLYLTCLQFSFLDKIESHELVEKLNKAILLNNSMSSYKYGSCIIYKNVNQIVNLYEVIINLLQSDYQNADGDSLNRNLLFNIMFNNYLATELKKAKDLQNFLTNNKNHMLSSYLQIFIIIVDVLKYLLEANFKTVNIQNFSKVYKKIIRQILLGEEVFENIPPILIESIVKLNKRFREFCYFNILK